MSPQLPYAQPQSVHAHGVAHAHVAGAFAQPHDFGAQQPSPQSVEQQPGVSKAIPAETMPAANRLRVEFFMGDSISQFRRSCGSDALRAGEGGVLTRDERRETRDENEDVRR